MEKFAARPIDGDESPEAILEGLQSLLSDVDAFVSDWFKRLDHTVQGREESTTADEKLRKRILEFQQEKIQWEAKRNSQRQRIEEQASQLTEAWLRLEAEQRRFLQMKETHPQAGREQMASSEVKHRDPADSVVLKQSPVGHAGRGRDAAVRQFQRLRQEIAETKRGV